MRGRTGCRPSLSYYSFANSSTTAGPAAAKFGTPVGRHVATIVLNFGVGPTRGASPRARRARALAPHRLYMAGAEIRELAKTGRSSAPFPDRYLENGGSQRPGLDADRWRISRPRVLAVAWVVARVTCTVVTQEV